MAGGWPILGHLHLISREKKLYQTLAAMADEYEPTFNIWVGNNRAFVVSNGKLQKNASPPMTEQLPVPQP
ncbi:hypothetical protein K1719_024296 [Acacia pycnantha]|nr:hypothetical protein K1719_024296 [Acacia pycnantha]